MTKLLDLVRDYRRRSDGVEDLETIKCGSFEVKMKGPLFWSDGRFWGLEDIVKGVEAAVYPQSIKTLDEAIAAYRAGTLTKQQADDLAIARGWAVRKRGSK